MNIMHMKREDFKKVPMRESWDSCEQMHYEFVRKVERWNAKAD